MKSGACAADILLDATMQPDRWLDALRAMADAFDADHGFAYLVTPEGTRAFASRDSEEIFTSLVSGNWHERNPRMRRGLEYAHSGPVGILTDWRLFSKEEIARDPFEQEFARRYRCSHFAGTFIPFAPDSFLVIDFDRSEKKGPYLGSELRAFTRSMEQARRSIAYALKAQAHLATSLVDELSATGVAHAWLGSDGRLRHASAQFESLVGRYIGMRNGRPCMLDDADDRLAWLIFTVARGRQVADTVLLRNPADPEDIAFARVLPMPVHGFGSPNWAEILLSIEIRPPRRRSIEAVLHDVYGMTTAEIRLTMRMDEGLRLREAAEAEQIGYETARTRLKIIFDKLSIRRQTDLIRCLNEIAASSAPNWGMRPPSREE